MTAMARFVPLLFVLWVGVAVSTVVDLQKRIIGGQTCGQTERLYHVILIGSNGNPADEFFCGGSLISDRWILTAEHCQKPGWTIYAYLGRHPDPAKVEEMEIKAKPVIFKVKDVMGKDRIHDIMLLKLPRPTLITPVPLPDCARRPNVGRTVYIAGHAATTTGPNLKRRGDSSLTLQCANIPVVDCMAIRQCVKKDDVRFYAAIRYQHIFCAQSANVDVSHGDSGGGVVYNDMIYGVISFVGDAKYACTAPVGFMEVCEYMDWISKTISRPQTAIGKLTVKSG